ncbi:transglycosylase SLT domain-containing protein [Streptomyces sp. NPDC051776]|uniref:transglycosylase SLT domain-containing protein n=1 Tax=Streptomyces sp. NPDC051776 TaxID=3155414 RepID=UPI00341E3A9E
MSQKGAGKQAADTAKYAYAIKIAAGAAGGMGCLASPLVFAILVIVVMVFGGLGVLLAPILIFFNTGDSSGGSYQPPENPDRIAVVIQGDGKGKLDKKRVPQKLRDSIKDAGAICDAIGPVVIAAQIERETNFREDYVGPDGNEGISQLPKDVFERLGEDTNNNGETSAFDAEDSIRAQGRYLCELAGEAQELIDQGASGSVLDLTLAAYNAGTDAVREAKGVPQDTTTQSYVSGVRALFPRYQGVLGDIPPPTDTVTPTPTGNPTP